jgi:hypothetical protein
MTLGNRCSIRLSYGTAARDVAQAAAWCRRLPRTGADGVLQIQSLAVRCHPTRLAPLATLPFQGLSDSHIFEGDKNESAIKHLGSPG